ncbi:MAG: hypothetical protein M3406_04795 [Chloroflexota bacterium]|nr:hypothetical protein [Chloroflexota bacterium]
MTADSARRIATVLAHRGLEAPARLLLDAHRPLAPLLSDLGAALTPLLNAVGGPTARDLGEVLGDERGMERIIVELDGGEERHAESD